MNVFETSDNGVRRVGLFIDGAYDDAAAGRSFKDRSPVTGACIAMVQEAGSVDVDRAVQAAGRALHGDWGAMGSVERAALLHRVADCIEARFDDFLELECLDTGKPASEARSLDIPRGLANFRFFAGLIAADRDASYQTATPDGTGALNYTLRVPRGVVGVICPWNLPLLLMTWKVAPALACGNTVVVKPSEETPLTATLLGEVMNDAGVPRGVFNVVNGFGADSAGEFLTRHPDVAAITFTGESATGTAIMKAAAQGVRDVSFELGGKNPALVFADCDLQAAIDGTARSAFANCGQVCLGTERVYVQRPIFDRFVAGLKARAEALIPGRPDQSGITLGPMVSAAQRDKVLSYYQQARAAGATVVSGGGVPDMPGELSAGYWIQPTIWTGLPESSPVVREEIFGPCCHVAPFDGEIEALRLANDTEYGLAATVWTRDLARAHRLAAQVECGICWINTWYLRDLRTPFGGSKLSGIGREGGVHSLDFYSELRTVCVKL